MGRCAAGDVTEECSAGEKRAWVGATEEKDKDSGKEGCLSGECVR